jgi:hypothetical protein
MAQSKVESHQVPHRLRRSSLPPHSSLSIFVELILHFFFLLSSFFCHLCNKKWRDMVLREPSPHVHPKNGVPTVRA